MAGRYMPKVWILVKHTESVDAPIGAFDNESAAFETHDTCQKRVVASDTDGLYFEVVELGVRGGRMNSDALKKAGAW